MFLTIWIDDAFAMKSFSILVIHITTFAVLAAMTIVWQITESFKRVGLNIFAVFLWVAISIPLMIILSGPLQTEGVAIGRLIGVFIFIPMILYVEGRFLGGIFWRFWGSVLWKITLAAAAAAIVEKCILSWIQPGWPCLIFSGVAGGTVYGAVIIAVEFFSKDERNMVRQIMFGKNGIAPG